MDSRFEAMDEAVTRAALATQLVYKQEGKIRKLKKSDSTPVTAADLASQSILLTTVANHFPEDHVYAEESPDSLKRDSLGERVRELVEESSQRSVSMGEIREAVGYRGASEGEAAWFVDPLDGTRGFLVGLHYSIAAARTVSGRLQNSWLAVPSEDHHQLVAASNKLFVAHRGAGAKFRSLKEGAWKQLPSAHSLPAGRLAIVASKARKTVDLPPTVDPDQWTPELLSMDSQAKYAALAIGRADIYPRKPSVWFGSFFCWDHAAGALLIQETGGKITDLAGKELDWTRGERLKANRGIFAAASVERHNSLQPLFAAHVPRLLG